MDEFQPPPPRLALSVRPAAARLRNGDNTMKTHTLWAAAAAVALFAGGAEAAGPIVYDTWQSGNAGFECSQIGKFAYSWKWNESYGEGAPNKTETANFYDLENNLIHSNSLTIFNSDGSVFDWISNPNGIGAVIVKAGSGANVWLYDPQATSDSGLYAYQNREIVTLRWRSRQPSSATCWRGSTGATRSEPGGRASPAD
jgi:hypothetical protein